MAEPNDLQHTALLSLRNGIPSGSKLLNLGYGDARQPKEGERFTELQATRTYSKDGTMVIENYVITMDGKARKVS